MNPIDEAVPVAALSENQREEVLAQLELILASSLFRQSKRYPAFLRYVVESTLQGGDEELKERTIGMEVFGRLPHYDTSMDPTVRLTAAEVRKRLAQYYQQPEHMLQLHIDLHPGSYVPAFSWRAGTLRTEVRPQHPEAESAAIPPESAQAALPLHHLHGAEGSAQSFRRRLSLLIVIASLLVTAVFFAYRHVAAASNTRDVWAPVLSSPAAVSLVLPDLSKTELLPQAPETESTTVLSHIRNNQLVDFNDSVALAKLSGLLGKWNKPFRVLLSSETSFEDLQSGPSILIGAVDNPWTMRFLEPLPYSVVRRGDTMIFEITGKEQSPQYDWSIDLTQPFGKVQQDFGIVARELDTMTGRPVMMVAGLGQNGTAAGIRLLTYPELARKITEGAPKGWSGRNLEIVFRTQIIDDKFGPPVIVAAKYW